MTELLNNEQLTALLQSGPALDKIEPHLKPDLRDALVALQVLAADAYASGEWKVPSTGEIISNPPPHHYPTREEATLILGEAYLTVQDAAAKTTLKRLLDDMKLVASVPPLSADNSKSR